MLKAALDNYASSTPAPGCQHQAYAHTTLSRSMCEAAVRHAWPLEASISYEERIRRSAAMLFANAELGKPLAGLLTAADGTALAGEIMAILREYGGLPECWIPPSLILERRALLETHHDLRAEHTAWAQLRGVLPPGRPGPGRGREVLAERLCGVGPATALAVTCWLGGAGRFSYLSAPSQAHIWVTNFGSVRTFCPMGVREPGPRTVR